MVGKNIDDPIALSLFSARVASVCDEMGAALKRAALSPNIRDRLDYSCAVFDAGGQLCAQAAHIPVHLGSMAYAMSEVVAKREWHSGDQLIFNDPFLGGTHLPDITIVAPVFRGERLIGFVANRAHHADIGADAPGSMPISRSLEEEGIIIPPTLIEDGGEPNRLFTSELSARLGSGSETAGDLSAQMSANRVGVKRLIALGELLGDDAFARALRQLNDYGERVARNALADLPQGQWTFEDFLDDDGLGGGEVPIHVHLAVHKGTVTVDLRRCGTQVSGNLNCPLPVTAAAVHYVFRCLMPASTPACAGSMRPITIRSKPGTVVHAKRPAAVVAGNVETSQRIVDAVLGALAQALPERVPAASQGTMNNVAMGNDPQSNPGGKPWAYYETIGGGAGASPDGHGLSGRHCHMTNTLNTPIEVMEAHYPLRVHSYRLRSGSGGPGCHQGGDGVVREYEFLAPARMTVLSERRRRAPWGLAGGEPGACGVNTLDGDSQPGKFTTRVRAGQRFCIETPGGGGWGQRGT